MPIGKFIGVLVIATTGIFTVFQSVAQEPQFAEISPASSTLLDNQKFDLTFTIHADLFSTHLLDIKAYLNGVEDVTGWFKNCFQRQNIQEPITIFMCRDQSGMSFGLGWHELNIKAYLSDGSVHEASSVYKVVKNQRPYLLPFSFFHPSSSPSYNSGITVSAGEKLKILASGKIIVWASNPSFPVASPKGNGTTCNTSTCLVPGAPTGALLVRVGPSGRWLVAGDYIQLTADRAGELIFAVNDKNLPESWTDNLGSFDVIISR